MVVVNQVQKLLKRQTSRIPASMQLERRPVMVEDPIGRFHCIDTTFVLEWNSFIHYLNRAYYAQHGRELVGSPDHDTYNDGGHLGPVWPPRESDGIHRPKPHIVITQSDLNKGISLGTSIEFRLSHVDRISYEELTARYNTSGCFRSSTLMASYET